MSDTLQLQGQCFLPGIGLLHIVRSPAEKSYQKNQLNPPSYEIVLDPAHRGGRPEISIEQRMAEVRGMTLQDAQKAWKETADQIKEKLSAGSSVELEGLGLLNIGEEGTISFVGTHIASPIYDTLSLNSIKELTGKSSPGRIPATATGAPEQSLPETSGPEQTQTFSIDRESKAQPKPRWWIIGSIVVLILVGWFAYRGTMQRKKRATHIDKILHHENAPASRQIPLSDSLALLHDTLETAAQGNDSIHYFIVIAEYKDMDRALHQYKKMRNWGHPVVLRTRDSITYKLAFRFTSLPGDTTISLVNMMKLYGEKTHIEYNLGP